MSSALASYWRTQWITRALAALQLFVCAGAASGQNADDIGALRREVAEVKQTQVRMLRELQEIRSLLQQTGRAATAAGQSLPAAVNVLGSPVLGIETAPITVVEFSDYQCPFCGQFFSQSFPSIYDQYIRTGKVKYVLRDFPIQAIHPHAFVAAEAAHCAGDHGKFWEMHDQLFANQMMLTRGDLSRHARNVGIDPATFEACLRSGKHAEKVRADLGEGQRLGVNATPTFFIGLTKTDSASGAFRPVHMIRGAKSFSEFDLIFKALLADSERRQNVK